MFYWLNSFLSSFHMSFTWMVAMVISYIVILSFIYGITSDITFSWDLFRTRIQLVLLRLFFTKLYKFVAYIYGYHLGIVVSLSVYIVCGNPHPLNTIESLNSSPRCLPPCLHSIAASVCTIIFPL
ncbi:hypothetical protein BDZ91DRAFT_33523 [Kalaharituber pfeilii]|nr:hypothetical protein BDZ91DRAFT_33523 [Kalaharituber pfeilii]